MIQRPPRTMHISYTTLFETIYYTTDGSTPTTSSAVYAGALTFTQTTTLKAMAAASGMTNSAAASATYHMQQPHVATPTFSAAGWAYIRQVTAVISETTHITT